MKTVGRWLMDEISKSNLPKKNFKIETSSKTPPSCAATRLTTGGVSQ
jgi:hypothetical protein